MKKISISGGLFALVDDEDFDQVSQFRWFPARRGQRVYAARNVPVPDDGFSSLLHRFVLRATGLSDVAHENGDGLDCQKGNLLQTTRRQNLRGHQRKRKNATSKYRGVSWDSAKKLWAVYLNLPNGRTKFAGRFLDEETAAKVWDAQTRVLFGSSAQLNFPNA